MLEIDNVKSQHFSLCEDRLQSAILCDTYISLIISVIWVIVKYDGNLCSGENTHEIADLKLTEFSGKRHEAT